MIYDPFLFVSNDLIVNYYRKALELKFDEEIIQIYFNEIKRRNLRIDKRNHLKRIK